MKKPHWLALLALFFLNHSFAQDQQLVDSLLLQLKNHQSQKLSAGSELPALYDTAAANILKELSVAYWFSDYDKATDYAKQCLMLSEKIGYKKGIGTAYNLMGIIHIYKGDCVPALEYLTKALEIRKEIGDQRDIVITINNIASAYYSMSNYAEALKYYLEALKINEEDGDKELQADNYGGLAIVYTDIHNYPEAIKYHLKCIELREEIGDDESIAWARINLAEMYLLKGDFTEALDQLHTARALSRTLGKAGMEADILTLEGKAHYKQGNYPEVLKTFLTSLSVSAEIGEMPAMADAYNYIGAAYSKQKKYNDAETYLKKGLTVSKEIGSLQRIMDSYRGLTAVDSAQGDFASALMHYKLYFAARDSMMNAENSKKILQQQMQYEFDKKEASARAEQELKDAITAKQLQTQKYVRNGFMGGFGVVLLFAGVFFAQRNRIKNANKLILKEKELAEQQRIRAEQSEKFKQQFLANMSHEIRTPMNAVLGMTNLLIDKSPRPDQHEYLDGIQKSSDTLLHIINDILDLSKIEEGKMELEQIDFSIHSLVDQVRQTLNYKAEEKGLHLITEIDKSIPEIMVGDPNRLKQVLINLAGNAIKFTEKGSVSLKVSSEQLEVSSGELAVSSPQLAMGSQQSAVRSITFKVIDTGIGIPKDKLEAVFESFSQAHVSDARKFGGTGLGLSISKQLVELMGGAINIDSEVGVGTIFSFTIALAEGSRERLNGFKSSGQIDGSILNGLRILIVDDNEFNRIVAHDSLMVKADVSITLANNGKEALALLHEHDFDIVLMDVQMPEMDGYEATRHIRDPHSSVRNHHIPVIALTASVIRSDLDKCREAGMDDYVPKPFKTSQLITSIAKATGRELKFVEKK